MMGIKRPQEIWSGTCDDEAYWVGAYGAVGQIGEGTWGLA